MLIIIAFAILFIGILGLMIWYSVKNPTQWKIYPCLIFMVILVSFIYLWQTGNIKELIFQYHDAKVQFITSKVQEINETEKRIKEIAELTCELIANNQAHANRITSSENINKLMINARNKIEIILGKIGTSDKVQEKILQELNDMINRDSKKGSK